MSELEQIPISLWLEDAIVLFDWLKTVDLNAVPITHKAEKQALADLLTQLEQTEITGVTQERIDIAHDRVAKDMGW